MDIEAGKTLTNEEVIRELLDLLKKNAMKEQANDVFEICSYVDGLEKKIDSMTEELTNMQKQIKEMQEDTLVNNAKKALSEAQQRYAIILREEFSCLESITNRDTINWILKNEYRRSIMEHLPKRITENGIDYILVGDYYIPDLRLPEESRPIGRWGRMHRDYLKEWRPVLYNDLLLSGRFWTYLADLNEQAQNRLEVITEQMKAAEGITEELKRRDWLLWVQSMNNIRSRAEEIICTEMIFC